MDAYEATKIVFSRIQSLDPENATKIMGLLLLQDHGDKEMIRLAFGPESLLHSLVLKAHKDLGLGSAPVSPSPFVLGRQNSANSRLMQPQPVFSRSNRSFNEFHHSSDELSSPSSFKPLPFSTVGDLDEFKLQDQLPIESVGGSGDAFFADSSSDELLFPYGLGRRSCTAAEPCLYFARGFCKNGSACRFVHGLAEDTNGAKMDAVVEQQCHELLMRSRSPRSGASSQLLVPSFPYSPTGSLPSLSPSTPSKCLSFLLQQQQQHECQRIAAAAAALARTRLDPAARQIYLTFPADSTFREEDVSNYFSIYGPVQDVRIPYQQKRMFGFVTFVYPETVKLILAKGNPHFVCDSRVLVKPYKEKGKILERKQSLGERGEFTACASPTGLNLDSRGDAFDFQQLGAKMIYNTNNSHELLLRRKLEEQQQAAELQKAIELQQRRFMGLQLLNLKNRSTATAPVPINSIDPIISTIDSSSSGSSNGSPESSSPEYKSPDGAATMDKKVNSYPGILQETTVVTADKQESNGEADPKVDGDYQESFGHNLPDSPFASPKKSSFIGTHFLATEADTGSCNGHEQTSYGTNSSNDSFGHNLVAPMKLPTSSTFDMAPLKSCYFQMPRISDHGAIGM